MRHTQDLHINKKNSLDAISNEEIKINLAIVPPLFSGFFEAMIHILYFLLTKGKIIGVFFFKIGQVCVICK